MAIAAGAAAAELAERINSLATDFLLDSASAVSGVGASTSGEAYFHIGGEWFHLTPGVRAVIRAVIADEAE